MGMMKKSKGRMMLSRKIGNILLIISLAANFSVYAVDCRQVSSNTKIYQETDLSGGVLCLARSNGELEVIAFPARGGPPLENSLLVSESDISEGTVHIDTTERSIQIYFEYPSNVYLIEFDPQTFLIDTSLVVMTLRGVGDSLPKKLILETKSDITASSEFERISKNRFFSKENLKLTEKMEVQITAEKSNIYALPNSKKPTKMYLIKGDPVRLLSYRDGWFEFLYKTRSGKGIRGWIPASDFL